jgi:hypothetical protein
MSVTLKFESGHIEAETSTSPLWWQEKGLSYTRSGYGSKIPTDKVVHYGGRRYRVYCCIYSNVGTCYIVCKGKKVIVD